MKPKETVYLNNADLRVKPKETEVSPREFTVEEIALIENFRKLKEQYCQLQKPLATMAPSYVREVTAPQSNDSERLRLAVDLLKSLKIQSIVNGQEGCDLVLRRINDCIEAIGPLDKPNGVSNDLL